MAKANLDIAGANNKFPDLGEVIVNAGDLGRSEKARILYRHAKAIGLGHGAKELVKRHASLVVNHPHFTPERIRRLVEELIPKLAIEEGATEDETKNRLSEALANPTKQMQVSFRKLPACHRWMMFALLNADEDNICRIVTTSYVLRNCINHIKGSLMSLQKHSYKSLLGFLPSEWIGFIRAAAIWRLMNYRRTLTSENIF